MGSHAGAWEPSVKSIVPTPALVLPYVFVSIGARRGKFPPRTSDFGAWRGKLPVRTSDVGGRRGKLLFGTSDFGPRRGELLVGTSDVGGRRGKLLFGTSDFGPRRGELPVRTSDVGARASRVRGRSAQRTLRTASAPGAGWRRADRLKGARRGPSSRMSIGGLWGPGPGSAARADPSGRFSPGGNERHWTHAPVQVRL